MRLNADDDANMWVLRDCHDSDLADVRGFASSLGFAEGHVHCKLDGQASHGAGGQRLNLGHGLDQRSLGFVGFQRDFVLHSTGVVDHTHTSGVRPDTQTVDHFGKEDFDLLELRGPDASRAVDDEHHISGLGVTQACS